MELHSIRVQLSNLCNEGTTLHLSRLLLEASHPPLLSPQGTLREEVLVALIKAVLEVVVGFISNSGSGHIEGSKSITLHKMTGKNKLL